MIRLRRFIGFYRQWRLNRHSIKTSFLMARDLSRLRRNR